MLLMKERAGGLLNLVYPPLCAICDKKLLNGREENLSICEGCSGKIRKNLPPFCKKCGRSLYGLTDAVEICSECFKTNLYYEKAWSGFLYEGVVKEALHLLKYSKKISLISFFCSSFTQFLRDNPEIINCADAVLAVPLHNTKLREREFNQAHILAKAIVKEFNIKDLSGCLRRVLNTRPQSELDKKDRFENVTEAFEVLCPELARGKNLLIVDDLFTTGATLNECARVLKKAGAEKIYCLTFARGA